MEHKQEHLYPYKAKLPPGLDEASLDRIIEMAWEDRTPFEAIERQFGLKEKEVIKLMRRFMKASSFKMWRKRTNGQTTKHEKLRAAGIDRFKSKMQRTVTHNKISKRP
ncbi:MAG: TIGR03643 family protein [Bacteroidetes bacterium]|nr:TIGR03643 family protein [Bacteroidota bacterium]